MLKKLFVVCLFASSINCCELPEHLRNKDISIRTPDDNIGIFSSYRVKNSESLCHLALCKKSEKQSTDIDLTSDKENVLKYFLTQEKLHAALGLAALVEFIENTGTTDSSMKLNWHKANPSIKLDDPFEYISLIDAIKYLDFGEKEKKVIAEIFDIYSGSDSIYTNLQFKNSLDWYSQGKSVPCSASVWRPYYLIPIRGKELNLNELQLNVSDQVDLAIGNHQLSIYNNNLPSIICDGKKGLLFQDITIVNQPHQPVPSIQFKNISGYDGLSLTLKNTDVTTEEYQQLRKILWPPWYKPTILLNSLKYGSLQTLVIGGSLLNLTLLTAWKPIFAFSDYLFQKSRRNLLVCFSLAVINAIPMLTSVVLEGSLSSLRKTVYKHYKAKNELSINGEKSNLYFPTMIKRLHQKLLFIIGPKQVKPLEEFDVPVAFA